MAERSDTPASLPLPASITALVNKRNSVSEKVEISLSSPDKTMHLKSTLGANITIEFSPGAWEKHTARSVERQLSALLRAAVAARRVAFDKSTERAWLKAADESSQ